MSESIFSGVKQWEYTWKNVDLKLPVFFHENTVMNVAFTASTKEVKKLLPHNKMRPIEIYPGRCFVAISAVEYRKSDLGKYNELIIAFPITYDKPQIPLFTIMNQLKNNCFSSYIWQLPVTEELPRKGGVELFGYPKFIADISFTRDENWVTCTLEEDNEHILTFKGKVLPTSKGKTIKYVSYTMLDELPLIINSQQNNQEYAESRNKKHASVEIGANHHICKSLDKLKLGKHPFSYQYSPKNELILFPMRNLKDN